MPAYTPPSPLNFGGYPCYNHNSLANLLENAGLGWRYYLREGPAGVNGYGLWTAPAALNNICNSSGPGGSCQGNANNNDWKNDVYSVLPGGASYPNDYAPILTDIETCKLPAVSWVIPDGNWSDHAGSYDVHQGDGGPSWVAAIVNAVGNSYASTKGACDYWGGHANSQPTVILVVWDDWGGYYDDVPPPDCNTSTGACSGYSNGTGQQYVYGFRVPLLVIGAYTKQTSNGLDGFTGYISGNNVYPPVCPGTYCHDFGSILNFTEYAFGLQQGGISSSSKYPYADALAMDAPPTCATCTYSLSDFFTFNQSNFHSFAMINGAKYPEDCFHHPGDSGCFTTYPIDPDDDANGTD